MIKTQTLSYCVFNFEKRKGFHNNIIYCFKPVFKKPYYYIIKRVLTLIITLHAIEKVQSKCNENIIKNHEV